MSKLSDKEYWDNTYRVEHSDSITVDGFRHFSSKQIYDSICQLQLEGKKILEIGAGDSQWLPFLAREYPDAQLSGLDYSEIGCRRLQEKSDRLGLNINVIQGDLFDPPEDCVEQFDVILSFGVVEHFDHLNEVMAAIAKFLKPDGRIYTIIPNMSGLIGSLAKAYDKSVYDIHNPHDRESLVSGHLQAGLVVDSSSYVGSNNFRVLSSCIDSSSKDKSSRWKRWSYLWLSRLTFVTWYFESRFFTLPRTAWLSPYVCCVSRRAD